MTSLYRKYRPKTFKEVVGQSAAIKKIKKVLARGWGGQAFWISGDSGTGKTTLAKIIAGIGADDFFIEEFESPAALMQGDTIRYIERSIRLYSMGKGGRAFIINEAHGLRKPEIRWLLGLLEQLPDHVVFVFTTTKQSEYLFCDVQADALPLLSRCINIELKNNGYVTRSFAKLSKKIARREKLDSRPLADYIKLTKEYKNNMRTVLQKIEAGIMLKNRGYNHGRKKTFQFTDKRKRFS